MAVTLLISFMLLSFGVLLIGVAAMKSAYNPEPELADRIGFLANPIDKDEV